MLLRYELDEIEQVTRGKRRQWLAILVRLLFVITPSAVQDQEAGEFQT